jgi:GH25 family lysozyme M1 (1,4-beta-N-acetylmuramidase)
MALVAATATGVAPAAAAAGASAGHATTVIDGPDVSSYQHPNGAPIHWRKVAVAHHEFAIVKATEGNWYRNPWFRADYQGAHRAGLARGSYHFARPAYPLIATARAQARFFVSRLGSSVGTRRTLPPALDLEVTGGLGPGALVTWAQTFLLETRRLTGRTPMIYTYPYFWTGSLRDAVALARYPLWMASYSGGVAQVDPSATFWQYTSGARVRGISGAVDMSRLLADTATWAGLSNGRVATPWPAATPGAPQQVRATGADRRATVSWLPGDTGSTDVRSYRVAASVAGSDTESGSVTVPATAVSAIVPGLTNGVAYTFTVQATNGRGPGMVSDPSTPVVPLVPTSTIVTAPTSTAYGDDALVRVRLVRPDTGAALAGRDLTVEQRSPGTSAWTAWETLTTGDNGWVGVRLSQLAHSVELRFSFTGPSGWHSTRVVVPVVVRSGITAKLSTSRVRAGHEVTMAGSITPAVAGVTVLRQGYYGHGWHVWASTTTLADGSYSFAFTPTAKTTDIYRTVVAAFDGRSRGYSPVRTLRVH